MKQCSSDQFPSAAVNMKLFTECYAISCHIHHMCIYCHISVLDVSFCPSEIPGFQNIGRVYFNLTLAFPIEIHFPPPPSGLSLCTLPYISVRHISLYFLYLKIRFPFPLGLCHSPSPGTCSGIVVSGNVASGAGCVSGIGNVASGAGCV